MKKMYGKLAFTNMKNNRQFYLPYVLTGMVSVIMFYTMVALFYNEGIKEIPGGYNLLNFLSLGEWVIGIFVTIFLFYTNSFIMKRRKKELGIYNILGMEKKHISKVLFIETAIMSGIIIVGGLILGIVFHKLFMMILYKLIHFSSPVQFEISMQGIKGTMLLFASIFIIIFAYNLLQVKLANPIELLRGGNVGEKEPKTKLLMTILGVISLGIGYYIALTTNNPLSAIMLFFVAVVFVIVGTYCLFTAGSIAFLKMLRRNKKFYYKTNHFTAVSGMLYRMKQNAVGLANICILSTMVLIIISCTVSMFVGVEDELETRFPSEITISAQTEEIADCEEILDAATQVIKESGRKLLGKKSYFGLDNIAVLEDGRFAGGSDMMEQAIDYSKIQSLTFLTPDGAKEICGEQIPELQSDEVVLYGSPRYEGNTVSFFGREYKVADSKEYVMEESYMLFGGTYYVILSDETELDAMYQTQKEMYGDHASNYMYHGYLDMDGTKEEKIACYQKVQEKIREFVPDAGERTAAISLKTTYGNNNYTEIFSESRAANEEEFFVLYGGFFFLGIFLGIMFLMVTALIIYFKQISEGYDDKERFVIMKKVGMSSKEVKASIASQVRIVFLLPILVAAIHVAFAYPIVIKLLALLNLTNAGLFRVCLMGTIVVFTLIYYVVFKCTSRTYYRIVGK